MTKTTTKPEQAVKSAKAEAITGLLQFAQFLAVTEIEPPFGYYDTLHGVRAETDEEGIAEVERLAAALGVEVKYGDHITADREFSGFAFRVYYIPQVRKNYRIETLAPGDKVVRAEPTPAPLDTWPVVGAPSDSDVDPYAHPDRDSVLSGLVEPAPKQDPALLGREDTDGGAS